MIISILLALTLVGAPPQESQRIVVGTQVVCRSDPARNADKIGELRFASTVSVEDRRSAEETSDEWLFVRAHYLLAPCWVLETLTARKGPDPAADLLTIVDHMLATSEGRPLADFVEAEILFTQGWVGYGSDRVDVDASPLLSLRRLELLGKAVGTTRRREMEDYPFQRAWILSHGTTLRYFEPGGMWFVRREEYDGLYERFSETNYADELAWAAARQPRYDDCEGGADCYLTRPIQSVARYWVRFPAGRFVSESISLAVRQLQPLRSCDRPPTARAGTEKRLRELRDSLEAVEEAEKEPVLTLLREFERGC